MTALAGTGLLLMVGALWLMLVGVRGRRFSYVGVVLFCAMFMFHFLGEVLNLVFSERNIFRAFVPPAVIDPWLVTMGLAMLGFAAVYTFKLGREDARMGGTPELAGRWPHWSMLLMAVAPLWVFAVGIQQVTGRDATYWTDGLVNQFLLVLVPLTALLYVHQSQRPHPVVALLIQSLALVLIGERSAVLIPVVTFVWGSALLGHRLKWRSLTVLALIPVALVVSLSATRVLDGRLLFGETTATRAEGLVRGLGELDEAKVRSGVIDDFVYRIDGNAWPAYVMAQSETEGTAPLGGLKYDLTLAIPSFLFRSKLDQPELNRDEEQRFDQHFAIPAGDMFLRRGPDWLPTLAGAGVAYLGPVGLFVLACLVGWILGAYDARRHRGYLYFSSLIVAMGLVQSFLGYEGTFQQVVLAMRGILLLWCAWWIWEKLTSRQVVNHSVSIGALRKV